MFIIIIVLLFSHDIRSSLRVSAFLHYRSYFSKCLSLLRGRIWQNEDLLHSLSLPSDQGCCWHRFFSLPRILTYYPSLWANNFLFIFLSWLLLLEIIKGAVRAAGIMSSMYVHQKLSKVGMAVTPDKCLPWDIEWNFVRGRKITICSLVSLIFSKNIPKRLKSTSQNIDRKVLTHL